MQTRMKSFFNLAIPSAVILLTLALLFLVNGVSTAKPGSVPHNKEIEERYGIEFTSIHLSAENGMIDLRYRVLDVGKAKDFGHYTENTPMLIEQDNGKIIDVAIMGFHNHRVELGRMYYLLYRNTGNVIHSGSTVTIKIGNMSIENVVIQ